MLSTLSGIGLRGGRSWLLLRLHLDVAIAAAAAAAVLLRSVRDRVPGAGPRLLARDDVLPCRRLEQLPLLHSFRAPLLRLARPLVVLC